MGNHEQIAFKTSLILCAGLLFWHCSDDPIGGHLLDQPFSRENYVFPATVVDTAGNPMAGVAVDMDYVLMYENQILPRTLHKKAAPNAPVQIDVDIDIYNMFDDLVNSLHYSYSAWDTITLESAPRWDLTDLNGNKVLPGLYYYDQIITDALTWEVLSKKTHRWFAMAGPIDTTDSEGGFQIPALPAFPVLLSVTSPTGWIIDWKYFKGWVSLTCRKIGYQTKTDTVYVFEKISPIVLRKVP